MAALLREGDTKRDSAARQLRFVYLQPGAIPGRARVPGRSAPQRQDFRGTNCAAEAGADRDIPGPVYTAGGRHLRGINTETGREDSDPGRVPGAPGDRGGL